MKVIRLFIALLLVTASMLSHGAAIMNITTSTKEVMITPSGSQIVSYTLTNNTAQETLTALSIDPAAGGGNPKSFSLTSDTCSGSSLVPAASCTFNVVVSGNNQPPEFTLSPRACAYNGIVCSQPTASNRPLVLVSASNHVVKAYIALTNNTVVPIIVSNQTLGTAITGFDFTGSSVGVGVTISSNGNTLYVANPGTSSNELAIVDLTGTKPITYVPVGSTPSGVAILPDQSTVYVANSGGSFGGESVTLVNTQTLTTSDVNISGDPYLVTTSPDGTEFFVSFVTLPGFVTSAYDASNPHGPSLGSSTPIGTGGLHMAAVSPDSTTVAISNPASSAIDFYNSFDMSFGFSIPFPSTNPSPVLFSPDGNFIYFADNLNHQIIVYNLLTSTTVATIGGVGEDIFAMSFDPSGSYLYVVPQSDSFVTVINTNDFSSTQISLPAPPLNLGINSFIG